MSVRNEIGNVEIEDSKFVDEGGEFGVTGFELEESITPMKAEFDLDRR